jgi:hypothetical protein
LIVDGNSSFEICTPSQKKIKDAKIYFTKELQKEQTPRVIKIFDKIETTELTRIEFQGKKDAALMFELQNNRGRDLTNMEKLKSYLMYQMYVYSTPDETEVNVENIANIFEAIYMIINDLKRLDEDSILLYHCNAYIKGYYYRTLEDIKDVFKKSNSKVIWIKDFIAELHTSFSNMKKMELSTDDYLKDLNELGVPAFAYPFFIKGYKYFGDDTNRLSILFHIMEIVVFRFRLINSRADIISRLNEILILFNGDLNSLRKHFKSKLNDSYYWGDERINSTLAGSMYDNNVINYLLWKYENSIQLPGYTSGNVEIENEQIEHISPQTPTNGNPIETGYSIEANGNYSDLFREYVLNSVGNLMLISGSHNSSIGNRPFNEKLDSYRSNPLLKQQAEIPTFASEENPRWDIKAIGRRNKVILDYSKTKWNFDNITM